MQKKFLFFFFFLKNDYYLCNAESTINITPCLFVSQSNYYMKNLKKFQAFALTQEEQKNVKGGKALVKWWRCWSASSNTAPINHMGDYNGDQAAVTACNRNPNCVGCELLGE